MKPVAIVGGGIAGLCAAFRLSRAGLPFRLYEAGARCGGVIQTDRREGYLAETGPNSILETSPRIKELVAELGLEGRRIYTDPAAENRFIVRNGRLHALPSSPGAFMATRLFTWRAKLNLMREPFLPRKTEQTEESVGDFVRRRLGDEFLDYAINPFVSGIYAGDPNRLSLQQAFPKLHALEQTYGSLIRGQILGARARKRSGEVSKQSAPKFSFDDGLHVLIDALRDRFAESIEFNAPVSAIARAGQEWRVTLARDARTVEHSAVLLAAPAHALAAIQFQAANGPGLAMLGGIEYPPVASVTLGFRTSEVGHALNGFGMLIPQKENRNILGTIFCSSLFPNRAPAGHATLTSYVGGSRAPELAARPVPEIVELVVRDLRGLLGVSGAPTFQSVTIYPKAIAQYTMGFGKFRDHMNALEIGEPGLFLAGHFRDGISLGDSILSGQNAAGRIIDFLTQTPSSAP